MVLISANGKIALYQVVSGIILVSALPLACILKAFGCNAVCVVSCSLMVTVVCALSRIVWCRKFFGIPCFCWFREVLLPVTLVTSLTLIPAMSLHFLLSTGPLRLFLVFSLVPATMLALSWLLGLTREEKEFIFRLLKNSICRLRCNFAS